MGWTGLRAGAPAKLWSSEELRELRELAARHTPIAAIATRLKRSESAIRSKAGMQGISLRNCHERQGAFHDGATGRVAPDLAMTDACPAGEELAWE